jgi:putative SOS response-associated peptidase YedK
MCGRFTQLRSWTDLVRLYRITEPDPPPNWPPRYNVAPTQDIAVVRLARNGGRRLQRMRWGLVPSWASDLSGSARMINARAETLAARPAFRTALARRHCLIVADGFYEWTKGAAGGKQPWRITWPDQPPLAFAGLWDRWDQAADGTPLYSCTIVTVAANAVVRALHDRMPAILDPAAQDRWLDARHVDEAAACQLLRPLPAERTVAFPVDPYVNTAINEGPRCIASLPDGGPEPMLG